MLVIYGCLLGEMFWLGCCGLWMFVVCGLFFGGELRVRLGGLVVRRGCLLMGSLLFVVRVFSRGTRVRVSVLLFVVVGWLDSIVRS